MRDMMLRHFTIFSLLCLLLAACGVNQADEALAAEHSRAGTQMAAFRATATVQSARLQTTLDFAQTQVAFAATQSQFLKATLVATGFSQAELNAFQRDVSAGRIILPTPTPRPQNTLDAQRQLTQSSLATPVPAVNLTAAPNAPRLENIVLATGVQNDCATGITAQFSADTPEIYVVANGYNIPGGSKIATRWRISGREVIFDFTTRGDTHGECLWFYIDQTNFAFEPGTWDVTWSINDIPVTAPIPFTVIAPGETMAESGG